MGLGHQILKAEDHRGLNIERDALENQYEGKVFTSDEIKSLCMDYNLRFLSSKRFKGTVDLELGVKIRNFFEKHKLNENKHGDAENFYIMAPAKAFNLDDRPVPPPVDPVLFYRPTGASDKYLLVHKWGNEFTVMRLLGGLMKRSSEIHTLFVWGISICLFNMIYGLWGDYHPFKDLLWSILWGSAFTFFYVASRTKGFDDNDKYHRKFSDQCWNSIYGD